MKTPSTSETPEIAKGQCPRCENRDIERELVLQTTYDLVSGVVLFCPTCGLIARALASDREAWFDVHKAWRSPAVPEETFEAFAARWPKDVGRPAYGDAEPLGPILP